MLMRKPVRPWRYRELRRKEKLLIGFTMLGFWVLAYPLLNLAWQAMAVRDAEGKVTSVKGGTYALAGFSAVFLASAVGFLLGIVLILIHLRPSRTVLTVTEDRLIAERQQWAKELADMRQSDAAHMEDWKYKKGQEMALLLWNMRAEDSRNLEQARNELTKEILRGVLSQVESGEIACRKCAGIDEAHHPGHDEE